MIWQMFRMSHISFEIKLEFYRSSTSPTSEIQPVSLLTCLVFTKDVCETIIYQELGRLHKNSTNERVRVAGHNQVNLTQSPGPDKAACLSFLVINSPLHFLAYPSTVCNHEIRE